MIRNLYDDPLHSPTDLEEIQPVPRFYDADVTRKLVEAVVRSCQMGLQDSQELLEMDIK